MGRRSARVGGACKPAHGEAAATEQAGEPRTWRALRADGDGGVTGGILPCVLSHALRGSSAGHVGDARGAALESVCRRARRPGCPAVEHRSAEAAQRAALLPSRGVGAARQREAGWRLEAGTRCPGSFRQLPAQTGTDPGAMQREEGGAPGGAAGGQRGGQLVDVRPLAQELKEIGGVCRGGSTREGGGGQEACGQVVLGRQGRRQASHQDKGWATHGAAAGAAAAAAGSGPAPPAAPR